MRRFSLPRRRLGAEGRSVLGDRMASSVWGRDMLDGAGWGARREGCWLRPEWRKGVRRVRDENPENSWLFGYDLHVSRMPAHGQSVTQNVSCVLDDAAKEIGEASRVCAVEDWVFEGASVLFEVAYIRRAG